MIPPRTSFAGTTALASWKERLSWALYDFASTVFSMNILTLYFAAWLVKDLGRSNTLYAVANGLTSALVVVSIPIFGALSDATQRRKPWVVAFTIIAGVAIVMIALIGQWGLPMIGEGVVGAVARPGLALRSAPVLAVLSAYVIANYAHQGAQPFYNAMMADLAPSFRRGRLSGLGAAFGYAGAIIGVLVTVPFFTGGIPDLWTISPGVLSALRRLVPLTSRGGRVSTFVPTAIVFSVFSLPLILFCRDHNASRGKVRIPWKDSFRDVKETLIEARRYPGVARFIVTSFLYQDAMGTVVANMALYAIFAMGFTKGSEATLLVILTLPAVVGSYLIGRIVDRIGPKRTLALVIAGWIILLMAMIIAPSRRAFWIVGALIGFIYGGVSTSERPMLLSLVPDAEAGRFFSLMVLSARSAAIVGPFVWAITVDNLVRPVGVGLAYRAGVVTVMLGMAGALWLLRGVPDTFRGRSQPA